MPKVYLITTWDQILQNLHPVTYLFPSSLFTKSGAKILKVYIVTSQLWILNSFPYGILILIQDIWSQTPVTEEKIFATTVNL